MRRALLFALLLGLALANPRVGVHEGFTRVVLDLPLEVNYRVLDREERIVVRLSAPVLEALRVKVQSPELRAYEARGRELVLEVAPGVRAKAFVLEGKKPGTYRLVLDLKRDERAPPPPKKPKVPIPVVVLDPGHGGPDPGAVGYVVEKEVALDVALRVKRILEQKGVRVVLTRDRDTDLAPPNETDLWRRKVLDLRRRAELADSKKNLFVSIHVNAAPVPGRGVETFILGRAIDPEAQRLAVLENGGGEVGQRLTRETETLSQKVLEDLVSQANQAFSQRLAHLVQRHLAAAARTPDRGVKQAPLYVLRFARTPAVLVEVGFANHPTEGRLLAQGEHRQRVAEGIARGILEFLQNGAFASR